MIPLAASSWQSYKENTMYYLPEGLWELKQQFNVLTKQNKTNLPGRNCSTMHVDTNIKLSVTQEV